MDSCTDTIFAPLPCSDISVMGLILVAEHLPIMGGQNPGGKRQTMTHHGLPEMDHHMTIRKIYRHFGWLAGLWEFAFRGLGQGMNGVWDARVYESATDTNRTGLRSRI
ncbi:hypothetical protein VTL71DRAFT_12396 [Oculimacula yallundae]|uniref:Uncharacterized protein n=1 Tax=Oculimacula yallundae TaxID=86028 RepID=A0ABR4CPM8_9HELO